MGEKGKYLLKALAFLFLTLCFLVLAISGASKSYTWIGAAICLFVTINFVRKAFEE